MNQTVKQLAALTVSAMLCAVVRPQAQSKTLDVYWVDVEGGAATLIVTPAGESVLIDTGYPDERGAPRIHQVATEVAGLKRIDHLVITHFHDDHFGGAAALAKLMPIGQVHDNGTSPEWTAAKPSALVEQYRQAFPSRMLLKPGDRIPLSRGSSAAPIALRLLGARQSFIAAPAGAPANPECTSLTSEPPDTSDNANSTAWLLELGGFRFYDAGDLTWNVEAKLACPADLVGRVDVYQVTHHGLDQSNNPVLLRTLAPTVTVMNNGARKGTETRTVATLASLPSVRARYQVHKNVRDDGQNSAADDHIANLPEQCAANYIRMRVAPDGTRYTIEIPATKQSQSFETTRRTGDTRQK